MTFWFAPFTDLVKKKVCRYLLHRYLGSFIHEKISLDQLNVDFYNGKGTISDIVLDPEVCIYRTSVSLSHPVSFFVLLTLSFSFYLSLSLGFSSYLSNSVSLSVSSHVVKHSSFFVKSNQRVRD